MLQQLKQHRENGERTTTEKDFKKIEKGIYTVSEFKKKILLNIKIGSCTNPKFHIHKAKCLNSNPLFKLKQTFNVNFKKHKT